MLEILNGVLQDIPIAVIAATTAGLLRAVAGWLENSMKDGEISNLEWQQLAGTVVQYFSYIMLLMVGIQPASEMLGNPVTQTAAASLSATLAFVLESLRTSISKMSVRTV